MHFSNDLCQEHGECAEHSALTIAAHNFKSGDFRLGGASDQSDTSNVT